ncbi:Uncharacterized protein LW93_11826 [Fusarium fujikuroi]|nr:Uncharacterized protein LW93_11826 [Fusarium fujikuroi]
MLITQFLFHFHLRYNCGSCRIIPERHTFAQNLTRFWSLLKVKNESKVLAIHNNRPLLGGDEFDAHARAVKSMASTGVFWRFRSTRPLLVFTNRLSWVAKTTQHLRRSVSVAFDLSNSSQSSIARRICPNSVALTQLRPVSGGLWVSGSLGESMSGIQHDFTRQDRQQKLLTGSQCELADKVIGLRHRGVCHAYIYSLCIHGIVITECQRRAECSGRRCHFSDTQTLALLLTDCSNGTCQKSQTRAAALLLFSCHPPVSIIETQSDDADLRREWDTSMQHGQSFCKAKQESSFRLPEVKEFRSNTRQWIQYESIYSSLDAVSEFLF